MVAPLVLTLAVLAQSTAPLPTVEDWDRAFSKKPVVVFVGAPMKNGIVDIGPGISDSIREIHAELRGKGIRTTGERADADIEIDVISREDVPTGSTVGGAFYGYTIPVKRPTIHCVLRRGAYERELAVDGYNWKNAAKETAQAIKDWIDQNTAALSNRSTQ